MKYLKLYENKDLMEQTIDNRWSPFTKEMHKKFWEVCKPDEEEGKLYSDEIKRFFNKLEKEYLESDSWDLFEVNQYWSRGYGTNKVTESMFLGLAKAHGPLEARFKFVLEYKDPWMILDGEKVEAYYIEEERVENEIKKLEDKIKKWKDIL